MSNEPANSPAMRRLMSGLLERVERLEPESAIWLRIALTTIDPNLFGRETLVADIEDAAARLECKEERAGRPANPWAEANRALWADGAPYALPDFNEEERRFHAEVFKAVREAVLEPLTAEDATAGHLQLSHALLLTTQSYCRETDSRIYFYMGSHYKCSDKIAGKANAAVEEVFRRWRCVAGDVSDSIRKTWSDPSAHERPGLPVEGSARFRAVFNAVKDVVLGRLISYLRSTPVQAQLCRAASDALLEAVKAGWQGYFSIELRPGATTKILQVYAAALDAAKAVNGDREHDA